MYRYKRQKITLDEWYEENYEDMNNIISNIKYYLKTNNLEYILDKLGWEYNIIKLLYKKSYKINKELENEISDIFENEYFDVVCDVKDTILEYSARNGLDIIDININEINDLVKDFSSYIDILYDNLTFDNNDNENYDNNYEINDDYDDY